MRDLFENTSGGGKLSPYSRVSGGVNWRYGMGTAGSLSSLKMSDREAEEKEERWWSQEGTEGNRKV